MTSTEYEFAMDCIERSAEVAMDHLDSLLMAGRLTQEAYDAACKLLDRQTEARFDRVAAKRDASRD